MFKKSSTPLIVGAIICFVLGVSILVSCVVVPTTDSNSESDSERNDVDIRGDISPEDIIPITPEEQEDLRRVCEGESENTENADPTVPYEPQVQPGSSEAPSASEPEQPVEPEEKPYVSSKDDPLLVLANVDNPLPEDFEVGELESVQGKYEMSVRAASYAKDMIAAAKEDGITLQLCSAYRARSLQQTLFDNKYDSYISAGWTHDDAYAKTATIIAIPGTSEHQTGLCMDVVTPSYQVLDAGYAETDAAKWLAENAWEYGFILRYPKEKQEITKIIFEPWHYRFVGIENAKLIKDSGLCLEEYLDTLE